MWDPELKKAIDNWIIKYPAEQKRSALTPVLLLVQEKHGGWLDQDSMKAVADYLEIPPVEVYEVATFYDMFHLSPVGRHEIKICTNLSCMLRGADELLAFAEEQLGIKVGETTADGRFTLVQSECLAACAGAPCVQIDQRAYHENMTPKQLKDCMDACAQEEGQSRA